MRSVLALCFLIVLCASANAAAREHHARSRHIIVRPSQAVTPSYVTPGGVRIDPGTTPLRVACGPTTTTLLPTMIHLGLAVADLRPAQDRFGSTATSRFQPRPGQVRSDPISSPSAISKLPRVQELDLCFCFRIWVALTQARLCPSQNPLNVGAMANNHVHATCNHQQPIGQRLLEAEHEGDCSQGGELSN